jgi:hypothetical protein
MSRVLYCTFLPMLKDLARHRDRNVCLTTFLIIYSEIEI